MARFIGRRVDIGLAVESTRGTGVAPTLWLPKTNIAFDDRASIVRSAESHGNIASGPSASFKTEEWSEGTIEGEIRDTVFGAILTALFGASPSTASFSGAKKHTYTLANNNTHKSLSIAVEDPNQELLYEMAMLDSLEIEVIPGEIARYTATFQGKRSVGTSGLSASYSSENRFTGKHLSLKVASAVGSLGAASKIPVKRVTLNFRKGLQRATVGGTLGPEDINNTAFAVDGTIELDYEDQTYKDFVFDETTRALRFDLVNTDVTIGSTNPALRFDFYLVDFEGWEPSRPNDEVATQTVNFMALWSVSDGGMFSDAYLVNEDAGSNY